MDTLVSILITLSIFCLPFLFVCLFGFLVVLIINGKSTKIGCLVLSKMDNCLECDVDKSILVFRDVKLQESNVYYKNADRDEWILINNREFSGKDKDAIWGKFKAEMVKQKKLLSAKIWQEIKISFKKREKLFVSK